jgi:predicted nucleic acid-binding protein
MKNMALLIDTNVMIDHVAMRNGFYEDADKIIELCALGKVKGYLASHTILNMFHILRKDFSVAERREILTALCIDFEVIGIDRIMILKALISDNFRDLEDDMQMQIECAISARLDYIITRRPQRL